MAITEPVKLENKGTSKW